MAELIIPLMKLVIAISIVTFICSTFIVPINPKMRATWRDVLRGRPYPERKYWEVVRSTLMLGVVSGLILSIPILLIMLFRLP